MAIPQTNMTQIGDTVFLEDIGGGAAGLSPFLLAKFSTLEGAKIAFNTVEIVDVAPGFVADSTHAAIIQWTGTLEADLTASGAGGLDTGSEASDTWYAVHVIGDTTGVTAPAAMLSLSATAPTLPTGYDVFRRVGWVRNKTDSDIRRFMQQGSGRTRRYIYDTSNNEVRVLNAGNAITYTDVDCSIGAPPTCRWVQFRVAFRTGSGGSGGDDARLRENGSTSEGAHRFRIGVVSANPMHVTTEIGLDASQLVEYQVEATDNSLSLRILGFEDEL